MSGSCPKNEIEKIDKISPEIGGPTARLWAFSLRRIPSMCRNTTRTCRRSRHS